MNLKLLACNVFQREVCACLVRTPNVVDVTFIELGEHEQPSALRELLQRHIDETVANSRRRTDAILLLFGLCGNATVDLVARDVPLIVPRAHDCATLLLGSREAFGRHFGDNPSRPFGCSGYFERGNDQTMRRPGEWDATAGATYRQYVEQYGEENARFIWDELHPPRPDEHEAVYIRVPEADAAGIAARFRQRTEEGGLAYVELTGSLRLIAGLIDGPWPAEDYLTVQPGQRTVGIYDAERVIGAAD